MKEEGEITKKVQSFVLKIIDICNRVCLPSRKRRHNNLCMSRSVHNRRRKALIQKLKEESTTRGRKKKVEQKQIKNLIEDGHIRRKRRRTTRRYGPDVEKNEIGAPRTQGTHCRQS